MKRKLSVDAEQNIVFVAWVLAVLVLALVRFAILPPSAAAQDGHTNLVGDGWREAVPDVHNLPELLVYACEDDNADGACAPDEKLLNDFIVFYTADRDLELWDGDNQGSAGLWNIPARETLTVTAQKQGYRGVSYTIDVQHFNNVLRPYALVLPLAPVHAVYLPTVNTGNEIGSAVSIEFPPDP